MILMFMGGSGGVGDGMSWRVRRVYEVSLKKTFGWRGAPPDLVDTLESSGLLKRGRRAEIQRIVDRVEAIAWDGINDRMLAEALDKAGLIKRWWNW